MTNPIKDIVKFNKEAGLLDGGYNHLREPAFLIEEALEGLNTKWISKVLANGAFGSDYKTSTEEESPKGLSRWIVGLGREQFDENGNKLELIEPSDLELFDKHIDAFVYTVGSMAKLGLSPQQIEAGIHVVMHSNFKKLGSKKDDQGKLGKPDNWLEIEEEQNKKLQAILDKR